MLPRLKKSKPNSKNSKNGLERNRSETIRDKIKDFHLRRSLSKPRLKYSKKNSKNVKSTQSISYGNKDGIPTNSSKRSISNLNLSRKKSRTPLKFRKGLEKNSGKKRFMNSRVKDKKSILKKLNKKFKRSDNDDFFTFKTQDDYQRLIESKNTMSLRPPEGKKKKKMLKLSYDGGRVKGAFLKKKFSRNKKPGYSRKNSHAASQSQLQSGITFNSDANGISRSTDQFSSSSIFLTKNRRRSFIKQPGLVNPKRGSKNKSLNVSKVKGSSGKKSHNRKKSRGMLPDLDLDTELVIDTTPKNVVTTCRRKIRFKVGSRLMAGFKQGMMKTNQDNVFYDTDVVSNQNCSLFAVFDGHGVQGHFVSRYLVDNLKGKFN